MNQGFFNLPYYILDFDKHTEIKTLLLELIDHSHGSSLKDDKCFLSKTDYFIEPAYKNARPYVQVVKEYFQPIINNTLGSKYSFDEMSCWYQQYNRYQTHAWHTHGEAKWACVYYLELDESSPGTQFKNYIGEDPINLTVSEGNLIIFPGVLHHRSPPNLSNKRKTVIAFNLFE